MAGTIILLNGTSSAGKTSIAKELQLVMEEPYLHVSVDHFLDMLPGAFHPRGPRPEDGFLWMRDGDGWRIEVGAVGHRLVSGMHAAVAAMAGAGNHVIVDHVLFEHRWLEECAELLADMRSFFVGVRCPRETALLREAARGDRTPGLVDAHFDRVHARAAYDLEVDTSLATPAACAMQIKEVVLGGCGPCAFKRLRQARTAPAQDGFTVTPPGTGWPAQ